MKSTLTQNSRNSFFGFIIVFVLLFALENFGQVNYLKDFTRHKYAYENLSSAIKSSNDGVREDAIYLVGKYRLIDFEHELLNQLDCEKNSNIKVLIGLALFRMESEKGMQKMFELSVKDSNEKVRRMSLAIYNEFITVNTNSTVAR
ncbi:MAG: hypothetical protein ACK4R9_02440 [Ignavibacterium sp.]